MPVTWAEESIEQTLSFDELPLQQNNHPKWTKMLERGGKEIRCRTSVMRIFENLANCLRLARAVGVEMHDAWIEVTRDPNLEVPEEHTTAVTAKVHLDGCESSERSAARDRHSPLFTRRTVW